MTDDDKTPPFPYGIITGGRDASGVAPPRVGPTMAQIADNLGTINRTQSDIAKRQQQMALMVDGFIGGLNRRFDVLHEELALLRATMPQPANDNGEHANDNGEHVFPLQRKRAVLPFPVKVAGVAVPLAVVLRLLGKHIPEYEQTIDVVLGLFGL